MKNKGILGICSAVFVACALAAFSCSSDSGTATETICDNAQDDDGDGKTDCEDPDCASQCETDAALPPDSGPEPDQGVDGSPGESIAPQLALQQTVIDSVTLPTSENDYQVDIDGSGPKNQLGLILGAFITLGFDLQTEMDWLLDNGYALILLELFGDSIVDETDLTVQVHLGADLDNNAMNNFSGTAQLAIAGESPPDVTLKGAITGGNLAVGNGTMVIPLPLEGVEPLMLTLHKASINGTVTINGLSDGAVGGALLETDLESQVLPAIAGLLTSVLGMTNVPEETKDIIRDLIDGADGQPADGTISVGDIKGSIVGPALKPDVDVDGDGTLDALSMGLGITTITCEIQK